MAPAMVVPFRHSALSVFYPVQRREGCRAASAVPLLPSAPARDFLAPFPAASPVVTVPVVTVPPAIARSGPCFNGPPETLVTWCHPNLAVSCEPFYGPCLKHPQKVVVTVPRLVCEPRRTPSRVCASLRLARSKPLLLVPLHCSPSATVVKSIVKCVRAPEVRSPAKSPPRSPKLPEPCGSPSPQVLSSCGDEDDESEVIDVVGEDSDGSDQPPLLKPDACELLRNALVEDRAPRYSRAECRSAPGPSPQPPQPPQQPPQRRSPAPIHVSVITATPHAARATVPAIPTPTTPVASSASSSPSSTTSGSDVTTSPTKLTASRPSRTRRSSGVGAVAGGGGSFRELGMRPRRAAPPPAEAQLAVLVRPAAPGPPPPPPQGALRSVSAGAAGCVWLLRAEGDAEGEDVWPAADAALRARALALLWTLLGERRLRTLGFPAAPVDALLWRTVQACCAVEGARPAAPVPLPPEHACGRDAACFRDHAHRLLEVCAPTRDHWKRFGWAGLTLDAVFTHLYNADVLPALLKSTPPPLPAPIQLAMAVVELLESVGEASGGAPVVTTSPSPAVAGAQPQTAARKPLERGAAAATSTATPVDAPPCKRKRGRPAKVHSKMEAGRVERVMLWRFLLNLLEEPAHARCIHWVRRDEGLFRITNTEWLARLWGRRHGNPRMTYEKMARAMRTYYRSKVLQPVPRSPNLPRKLVYKFNPAVIQRVAAAAAAAAAKMATEGVATAAPCQSAPVSSHLPSAPAMGASVPLPEPEPSSPPSGSA